MYRKRPAKSRIDRYSGPYERWVFCEELGLPFAFPAIRENTSPYYTALLEGGRKLPKDGDLVTRKPPLWNPLKRKRAVTPFAFHAGKGAAQRDSKDHDGKIADLLSCVRAQQPKDTIEPRFRINVPIAVEAWTPRYRKKARMRDWVVPDTRPKAIVALIDDGIPFAHRAFLDVAGRTRMSHVWLQSAAAEDKAAVPFGRELMNGNINALREDAGNNDDLLYRTAGAIDPALPELGAHLRRHATHGAHIAGMCAGNDSRLAGLPLGDDIQIIAVQLPNTIAWDTSGFGKEMYMLSALNYVFDRARAIASKYSDDPDDPEELPLIVNFSYGWSASRHDGHSEMELAIQELLEDRKSLQPETAIVMPMGNNFAQDMHGQITSADMQTGSYEFGWKLLPDDRTSSYLEIWLPEDLDPAGYTVEVTPPHGQHLTAGGSIDISADDTLDDEDGGQGDPRRFTELEMGDGNIGQLSADKHRGTRWRVMLALVPTLSTRGQTRRAPPGEWRIQIKQNAGAPLQPHQAINVWVQRDDDPSSLQTGGRQSRLVDRSGGATAETPPLQLYSDTLGFIRGFGGMNGVASSPDVTRIAGYIGTTGHPSYYSGASGVMLMPDGEPAPWGATTTYAAEADHSAFVPGIRSIGVRSGSGSRLSGTSGAAPAASRVMVANAAAGRPLDSGLLDPLAMPRSQPLTPMGEAKHTARVGSQTIPKITRTKPGVPPLVG